MVCPHCLISFFSTFEPVGSCKDARSIYYFSSTVCPSCLRCTINLEIQNTSVNADGGSRKYYVIPRTPSRKPLPPEVPEAFVADYKEACIVLGDSEKASAALSRRCLQHLLREKAGIKPAKTLDNEIQQVLDSKQLPQMLAESLDAVRAIGNFAAHPLKAENTGEIIDVEPGEAEWSLDVIEGLFDFYFVQPELLKQKRVAMNLKLAAAGKPPLK
jgi:hypothetical protein